MKYYAKFDEAGFPVGFWNNEVFPDAIIFAEEQTEGEEPVFEILRNPAIPEDCTEITEGQWTDFVNNAGARRWVDGLVVEYVPPEPEGPVVYTLYKSKFIERLDEDEADALEQALLSESAKLRQMYHAVEYFRSDDSLFAYLHWIVASTLGAADALNIERADELLANPNLTNL